jgi:hypothetical protein
LGANAAVLELDPEGTWRRKGAGKKGKGLGGKEAEAKRKEALAKAAAERLRTQVCCICGWVL